MATIAFHDPRLSAVSGGGETVTLQLAEILAQYGHSVSIVTRGVQHRSALFQSAIDPNIKCVEIPLPAQEKWEPRTGDLWRSDHLSPESIVFGEAAWPFYERTLFDLIIVSFIPDLTGLPVGVPVLLNVFGLPPDRATAALERPLLDRCRVITFASQYVAQQFGSLFGIDLQTLRAQVMYAGINQLFYEPTDKKLTQYDVCYVGRIEERKGVRSIIDAITYLKNKGRTVRLVMVGEGSEKMALMEAAAKLGIANQIQWMGAVSPKQVRQVLDQSLIFAYPTLKPEAFGCSNLEAMARSVAVITTNLGGTADYIQPGENAMVCPAGNPQMLGETIAMLLDSPERRESLASKGRSTAEIFSQDKMSRRWLDIVRNALITQPEAV